jgi:hypothetical protein
MSKKKRLHFAPGIGITLSPFYFVRRTVHGSDVGFFVYSILTAASGGDTAQGSQDFHPPHSSLALCGTRLKSEDSDVAESN